MYGNPNYFSTGWKLWGRHNGVEILDSILDCNADAWGPPGGTSGIGICQGAQDWTVRGNLFINLGVRLQPYATGYYFGRPLDNILIDQNIFRNDRSGGGVWGVSIEGYTTADALEPVEDATITNNFMYTTVGWRGGIFSAAGNGGGPQTGVITIAGNTIYGPFTYTDQWGFKRDGGIRIIPNASLAHVQQDYVIKSNIIANAGAGKNVEVSYAPTGFVADGNVYDPSANFRWNETRHWITIPFSQWKTVTGQDANSRTGNPVFVNPVAGDLHLDPSDTVARGAGVDITGITLVDFDGDLRSAVSPTAGADVGDAPVTYTLTVNSGTGDGSYVENQLVNIAADAAPSGEVFDEWTGDVGGIADIYAAGTTITMPGSDAAVTATYKEDPDALRITSWHSGAVHARDVGLALLEIPDDGTFSEPRSSGINWLQVSFSHAIEPLTFRTNNVEIAGLDVNGQPVDLSGILVFTSTMEGDTVGVIIFPTTPLPDYAKYVVRVSGVRSPAGEDLIGDADRIMTALVGDVFGDRRVNATDLSRVRSARTRLIDPQQANEVRGDVSCDGRVNASDLSRVRARRPNDARNIPDPVLGPLL